MKVLNLFGASVVVSGLLVGCSREAQERIDVGTNVLGIAERALENFPVAATNRVVDELGPDDVILAVNGFPLTKRVFDDMMLLKAASLMTEKGANRQSVGQQLQTYRTGYPKSFIAQRVFIDYAFKEGLVTPEEVDAATAKAVNQALAKSKKGAKAFLKLFLGRERLFYYEAGVSYLMNKVIAQRIPPKIVVNEQFVSNVQASVRQDNLMAKMTNDMRKTSLVALRQRIVSGEITFEKAAADYSMNFDGKRPQNFSGEWGTVEERDISDPKIAAAAFSLKVGEVSEVLEDSDQLHLVKVAKVFPAEKDAEGRVIARERRQLKHVYLPKEELYVEDSPIVLTQDLKRQMQMQAVDAFVMGQMTNGTTHIEYPNGRLLFK